MKRSDSDIQAEYEGLKDEIQRKLEHDPTDHRRTDADARRLADIVYEANRLSPEEMRDHILAHLLAKRALYPSLMEMHDDDIGKAAARVWAFMWYMGDGPDGVDLGVADACAKLEAASARFIVLTPAERLRIFGMRE